MDLERGIARRRRGLSWTWLVLVVAVGGSWLGCQSRTESQPEATAEPKAPDTLPPLERLPLDPPIRITATFGEYRHGHFHGGTDFSTELRIGKPVYAPVSGDVQRVQASGAGFGNNLMIRSADGRTILLAHLDAFDEPIASFLAAAQESTGRYEQTLVPERGRLPIKAGQRVAWSGDSGAGPAHLHMEVRWGDLAYNPLRFGFTVPDSSPPALQRVTLEPLDDTSAVRGGAAPRTFALGPSTDTVVVLGRVRAWVQAADGVSDRWTRDAPYAVGMDWNGEQIECRFDRIAWDEQMPAVEWVYDGAGRAAPGTPIGLWFGAEFHPTMLHASTRQPGAGVIQVASGDPPRVLALHATDAAGNRTERRLVLRPPRPGETFAPAPTRRRAARPGFELMPVDGPFVRLRFAGAPPGVRDLALGLEGSSAVLRPASFDGARWVAVVRVPLGASTLVATGRTAAGPWEHRVTTHLIPVSPQQPAVLRAWGAPEAFRFSIPQGGVFASTFLRVDSLATPGATAALAPRSAAFEVQPANLPLLRPADVEIKAAGGGEVYRLRGGWAALAAPGDDVEGVREEPSARVRALGRFALFDDVAAPRIGAARTLRIASPAPNHWALRCSIVERSSGLDLERTHFEIDGRRVPSEWIPDRATLRWRPLHPPAAGSHAYTVIAVDRAGHETRASGRFVAR